MITAQEMKSIAIECVEESIKQIEPLMIEEAKDGKFYIAVDNEVFWRTGYPSYKWCSCRDYLQDLGYRVEFDIHNSRTLIYWETV